jgi:hypothetical protein
VITLLLRALAVGKAEYSVLSVEGQGHCCLIWGVFSWCKILGVKDDEISISVSVGLGPLNGGIRYINQCSVCMFIMQCILKGF